MLHDRFPSGAVPWGPKMMIFSSLPRCLGGWELKRCWNPGGFMVGFRWWWWWWWWWWWGVTTQREFVIRLPDLGDSGGVMEIVMRLGGFKAARWHSAAQARNPQLQPSCNMSWLYRRIFAPCFGASFLCHSLRALCLPTCKHAQMIPAMLSLQATSQLLWEGRALKKALSSCKSSRCLSQS